MLRPALPRMPTDMKLKTMLATRVMSPFSNCDRCAARLPKSGAAAQSTGRTRSLWGEHSGQQRLHARGLTYGWR